MAEVALSFDVESLAGNVDIDAEAREIAEREHEAISDILEVLDRHGAEGTFFVVSNDFEDGLIAEIHRRGHEIGSHTRNHRPLSSIQPEECWDEIRGSKQDLDRITGSNVTGFRAPLFDRTTGFFNLLSRVGYKYDSSMVPSIPIPGRYGGDPVGISPFKKTEEIIEVPIAVDPDFRLPLSGFWLRLLGGRIVKRSLTKLIESNHTPVVYFHPYELFKVPKFDGVTRRSRYRTGKFVRTFLEWLVSNHDVTRVDRLVREFN